MALEPTHVTVAGTGAVYAAPEGTPLPDDLAPLASPWIELGYVGEDGCQFTFSRDQEDVNAWQSAEPVRVLVTAEPKTIEFELLEFDRESILFAFRGGSFAGTAAPYTYTPPDAGITDVRALVIDGVDGAQSFRFAFPRITLSGDVAFQLVRTDAVRLAVTLNVLAAAEKWSLISDLPGFAAGAAAMSALSELTRTELDQQAEGLGLNPADYATKADVIAAIEGAQQGATV